MAIEHPFLVTAGSVRVFAAGMDGTSVVKWLEAGPLGAMLVSSDGKLVATMAPMERRSFDCGPMFIEDLPRDGADNFKHVRSRGV